MAQTGQRKEELGHSVADREGQGLSREESTRPRDKDKEDQRGAWPVQYIKGEIV